MRKTRTQAPRRDPAPTILAYRIQRLALTPLVRRGMTIGLPVLTLALISGLVMADPERREAFGTQVEAVKTQVLNLEQFQVTAMTLHGASDETVHAIHEILPIAFPISSFDLDLRKMQAEITALDAVERTDIRVSPGGTLEIRVIERVPALVWRTGTGLILLDAGGHRTGPLRHREDRPGLPIVSGPGASAAAAEALDLVDIAAPIADRVRGFVRMGERRWDLVLSGDQRILLPDTGARRALRRVIEMNEMRDLLDRDIRAVDMRDPDRPTIQVAPETSEAMREAKNAELEGRVDRSD